MRSGLAAMLFALTCGWCAPASAQALQVELLLTRGELAGPPASAPVAARVVAAAPGTIARIPVKRRADGYWLRLTTDRAIAPREGALLVLHGARSLGPVTFYPPAAPARVIDEGGRADSPLLRRGWSLTLPNGWPAASVAYLRVEGMNTEPLQLRLANAAELIRQQRDEARVSTAAFTALMLMALVMLAVWIAFRDLLYLSYAGYVGCLAVYSMLLSGDAGEIWGLVLLDNLGASGRWAVATLAAILQLVFTVRFLELDRLMPKRARVLHSLIWLHFGLLAMLLIGRQQVFGWYYIAGNALLLLAIPCVLVIAVQAWRQGAAYAVYYLLGWSPLLLVVAMTAAHQLGLLDAGWSERALPMVAVLQSVVLALALSQHAANRHRIGLLARQSLERDPLTGALNRSVIEHMLGAWQQLGGLGVRRYGVLLLDLDRLRAVNTDHGRAVGDAVLQQSLARIRTMLRPEDTVARMEADTFAVVSESSREDCEQLAQRLADGIAGRPFRIDGHDIPISVSIGLAMSQRGESVSSLLARAAQALHSTRAAGYNAFSVSPQDRNRVTAEHIATTYVEIPSGSNTETSA